MSEQCARCGTELKLLHNWNGHKIQDANVCMDCFFEIIKHPASEQKKMFGHLKSKEMSKSNDLNQYLGDGGNI